MRRSSTALAAAGIALLIAAPAQQAQGWWGPWDGGGWRNAYIHDPAYRHAPPRMKQYLRDIYRYGPAYAAWREYRRHPYGYRGW